MSAYYTGRRAQSYNRRWQTFTQRTLEETLAMVDGAAVQQSAERHGRQPRILDAACGTGVLLTMLRHQFPHAELYGVDASADMLAQARQALRDAPQVHLTCHAIGSGEMAGLPYEAETFDLITCTNALHDLSVPVEVLASLGRLLTSEGQFLLEDYARREPPFPWFVVEWIARRIEEGHVRAYTLSEAVTYCRQAGYRVEKEKPFAVNWLWHGWVLRLSAGPSQCQPKNP